MIAKIVSKKRIGMTSVISLLSFALTAIMYLTNIKDLYNANSTDALPHRLAAVSVQLCWI